MKLTTSSFMVRCQDERQARRRMVSEAAVCVFGAKRWKVTMIDVSASGAFLESPEIPPTGGQVVVDFTLPFQDRGLRVRFQLRAVVVRNQVIDTPHDVLYAQGFSVRFLELSAKERLCLKAFSHPEKYADPATTPAPRLPV